MLVLVIFIAIEYGFGFGNERRKAFSPGNRSPNELPRLRPVPLPVGSSMLLRLGPALG